MAEIHPGNPGDLCAIIMALRIRIKIWVTLCWVLIWAPVNGFAQVSNGQAPFGLFSRLDGLTEATVTAICQDSRGFLWVGTQHGLNRYDGTRILKFYHAPFDTTTLSGNHITALWEDSYGMLWVGTREGLNRYNPRSGAFIRFQHNPDRANTLRSSIVTSIIASSEKHDGAQTLWVGTDEGLDQFEIDTPQQEHPTVVISRMPEKHIDGAFVSNQPVCKLYVDGTGRLWVSTSMALYHSADPCGSDKPVVFKAVSQTDVPRGTTRSNQYCSFIQGTEQSFWIVSGKAVTRVDETSNNRLQFRTFFYPGAGEMADPALATLDWRRKIFLLKNKDAPLLFDTHSQTFEVPGPHYARLANAVAFTGVYCDRSRNIWVGTAGAGLFKYHLRNDLFHASGNPDYPGNAEFVHSLHFGKGIIDPNGWLWYPHAEGLACVDPAGAQKTIFRHNALDSNSLSQDHVTVLLADPVLPERFLWVGTRGGGLNRFDRKTNRFNHYIEKHGLPNGTINAILPDNQGHLWVSTSQGLSQLQLNQERQVIRIQNFGQENG
ncbi:MAG: hypothetical protein KDD14_20625, partial [Saprospiraceae bacterium]|nr:hypothetical protein [Saprospiraceae bacterium]